MEDIIVHKDETFYGNYYILRSDEQSINERICTIIKDLYERKIIKEIILIANGFDDNLQEIKRILSYEETLCYSLKRKGFSENYKRLIARITDIDICRKILIAWSDTIYEERMLFFINVELDINNKINLKDFDEFNLLENSICSINNIDDTEYDNSYEVHVKPQYNTYFKTLI